MAKTKAARGGPKPAAKVNRVDTKKRGEYLKWVPEFLRRLAASPNISAAASAAGISRVAAYKHRNTDPEFAAAWEDALEQSTDTLVGALYERALTESDTLGIFLLKSHRPHVYRERIVHSGSEDEPIRHVHEHNLSGLHLGELESLRDMARRLVDQRSGVGPSRN